MAETVPVRSVPVPDIQAAVHFAPNILLELVQLWPRGAPSMETNPLRYPNRVAERSPKCIGAPHTLQLQPAKQQMLHTK
jgi:hypothetical protein